MAPSPEKSPSEESPPAPSGSNSSQDASYSPSKNSPPPSQSSPPSPKKSSQNEKDNNHSSPPPPKHKSSNIHSPPRSSNSHKTNGNNQIGSSGKTPYSDSSGNDIDTIIFIGAGLAVGLVLLFIICCIVCCCRKRKRKSPQVMNYDEHKAGGKEYYNSYQTSPWVTNGKVPGHGVPVPPPSGGGSGGVISGSGSQVPLRTPIYSGEVSSQFSGPHHPPPFPPPSPNITLGLNKSTFTYEELIAATNGFSQANLIGQGGFGYVYKGVLPNGKEVAIKSLKTGSGQGEREFQAEVEIISRVHHRHLVSLVGYCIAGGQRMLVYEFVPNKTLEHHLHGKDRLVLDFPIRLRIALGSAKGLAYLHEDCNPRIIHRDIKAANILLDNNFEAMVADFGLAKLSSDNYTHVSTRVMGTFGYMAPEYASSGKLTDRSDVFSFGVMLLELITGKQPIDVTMDDSLVDWKPQVTIPRLVEVSREILKKGEVPIHQLTFNKRWLASLKDLSLPNHCQTARPLLSRALEDGNFNELVDPRLEMNYNHNEMQRMIACAAASIRHSARKRPKMSQIVRILEGDSSLDDLNDGTKPGQSTIFGASGEYSSSAYNADMQRFRQLALGSQEFSSSEYGTSSGENSREVRPGDKRT